jgi:hypothetical protein
MFKLPCLEDIVSQPISICIIKLCSNHLPCSWCKVVSSTFVEIDSLNLRLYCTNSLNNFPICISVQVWDPIWSFLNHRGKTQTIKYCICHKFTLLIHMRTNNKSSVTASCFPVYIFITLTEKNSSGRSCLARREYWTKRIYCWFY